MPPRVIKKILVPTDFSETSAEAVSAAIDFALAFHAGVELIHVYVEPTYVLPPPIDLAILPLDMGQLAARVQQSLDAAAERVRAAGIPCETALVSGRAAPEIVERARKTGADLIVVGTHGRGGIEHAILGSVAERVVHHSPCPVLVIPAPRPPAAG
jgi:nucleotide-binding universal stress UspA family protein